MCLSLFLNCRILIMPYIKTSPKKLPLTKQLDLKAQKCGLRHTVFAPNGDQYTGEWLDDRKHGETPGRGQPSLWPRFIFFIRQMNYIHRSFLKEKELNCGRSPEPRTEENGNVANVTGTVPSAC